MCGGGRHTHTGSVHYVVMNNKRISRALYERLRSVPYHICSACNVARALSRVTLHPLGNPSTSSSCGILKKVKLSLDRGNALMIGTPVLYRGPLRAGSVIRLGRSKDF